MLVDLWTIKHTWNFVDPSEQFGRMAAFQRTIPKMVDKTPVLYEYHFQASFGQISKIAYFLLFFGHFPHDKIPKSKTFGALAQSK